MGKATVKPNEFFDLVMIFLYDIMNNIDYTILDDPEIMGILDVFKNKGLKTHLMQYYLHLTGEQRVKYKFIKDVFYTTAANNSIINILHDNDINENINFYDTKDTIKKCISLMKKQKYGNPNRIITDDIMDKIIERVLKEKQING
jgi:hypothetical protein